MKWINFLHIYQPPTQTPEIVKQVTEESYQKIAELLERYPKFKITLNITGSLIELWVKYGYTDIIERYRKLMVAGKIELVGSAMYHPILPLLSKREIVRQVVMHDEICRKYFGEAYKPQGFFLPEMAYGKKVGKILKELGYNWLILDEIHFPNRQPDYSTKYIIESSGLKAVFRDRKVSKMFPPEFIMTEPGLLARSYIVTAHDGELYGHWHKDDQGFYDKAFTSSEIEFQTVSEYLNNLKKTETIEAVEASWESEEDELHQNVAYGLWANPQNKIHMKLEQFKRRALALVEKYQADPHYAKARQYLDRGLASCAWWWASARQLTPVSPTSWNPTEIERGLKELLLALRTLESLSVTEKIKTEKMAADLTKLIWVSHWSK